MAHSGPVKVMTHNPNEYNLNLEYPDNTYIHDFFHGHIVDLQNFLNYLDTQIPNEKSLIVFFGLYQNLREVDSYPWLNILDEYYANRPNPMIVFNGRLTFELDNPIHNIKIPYHKLLMFDRVSTVNWKPNRITQQYFRGHRTYKFYWASSKDYFTRRYVLAKLMENDLMCESLVNYKCIHTEFIKGHDEDQYLHDYRYQINERYHLIKDACESIAHRVPLPPLDDTVEFTLTPINFYSDSYVGLVTDTVYDDTDVYLSEKIFNAMNFHQIFWYLGPAHTLKYLRDQGYQTFSDIIDESYDDYDDPIDRLICATNSIISFLKKPKSEIHQAYIKVMHKLQHNKKLLMSQRPDLTFTQLCNEAISKK